ncbi:Oligopeptide transport ATP-binding protein OppF [compost metagenome]
MQLIFQNPFDTFDPRLNIAAILLDALRLHQIGASDDERLHQCIDHMKRYGINPAHEYIYRYPHELSGGQLQRISILRSMLLQPQVLLADEPFSMLDVSIRADMMRMLVNLVRSQQMSMIFISHDIRAARWLADRVGVMSQGRIVEIGAAKEVLETPKHPYTQALLSAARLG